MNKPESQIMVTKNKNKIPRYADPFLVSLTKRLHRNVEYEFLWPYSEVNSHHHLMIFVGPTKFGEMLVLGHWKGPENVRRIIGVSPHTGPVRRCIHSLKSQMIMSLN